MFVTDYREATDLVAAAAKIGFFGNGGNLAIAQHAASDMSRHTGKFCFAPDGVSLTALGRDGDWKRPWVEYASRIADLLVGITTRIDSPVARALENVETSVLLVCPAKHPVLPTLHVPAATFHEFEVRALWGMYMIMERTGAVLPPI